MADNFLADAIKHQKRSRKPLIFLLGLIICGSTTAIGVAATQRSNEPATTMLTNKTSTPLPTPMPTQKATPTPSPVVSAPSLTTNPNNDMAVVKAKLCQNTIDDAKRTNAANNDSYMKTWREWTQLWAGSYELPKAQESKEWYKTYYRGRFSELVTNTDKLLPTFCGGSTSARDFLIQPDYSQWQ